MSSQAHKNDSNLTPVTRIVAGANLWVNPASGELKINAMDFRLEARYRRVLACLASHPDRVVTRSELCLAMARTGVAEVTAESVRVAICEIRRILNKEKPGAGQLILTAATGYRLVASVNN